MPSAVGDSSALVSLGLAATGEADPLSLFLERYDVWVPDEVLDELEEIASYTDAHGGAAESVLDRVSAVAVRSVSLDAAFPLDDGENAAVTLANEIDAALFLCDEFNRLGLIHASLADTRLVTTPTLLSVFVRADRLTSSDALVVLDKISAARSWDENSYVQQARTLLENA